MANTATILEAARAAYDAGLCVIAAKGDGTKAPHAPGGTWKQYQTERPDVAQLEQWFGAEGRSGMGVVCGAVSGNLEMLELEGRAVDEGLWPMFREACGDAGIGDELASIVAGYMERTPSGGLHLLYRCETIDDNLKLARRPAREDELTDDERTRIADAEAAGRTWWPERVLIETRGEGGFTVTAPSNGTTHPSGGAWVALGSSAFDRIVTIAPATRAALLEVARTFDRMPAAVERKAPPAAPRAPLSGSADDDDTLPGDEFNAAHTCTEVLERAGFVHVRTDGKGDYWRRPGKDTPGHSAIVWADNGTATLYSSSIAAPADMIGDRNLSPWQLHVGLNHGGRWSDAAREWRAAHPRQRRSGNDDAIALASAFKRNAGDDSPLEVATTEAPDAPVEDDPFSATLPDALWDARPMFDQIRQAARSKMISPDAVFGAVLARACVLTDWRIMLPAVVGREGSLNVCISLVGPPGAGKGSAMDMAERLLPERSRTGGVSVAALMGQPGPASDHRIKVVPLGSGEGLVHSMFTEVETVDVNPTTGKPKTSMALELTHRGLLVRVDEGTFFEALSKRSGQTTLETIRQAWSGEALGGTYVNKEKKARVDAHSYRLALVIAVQPELAKPIIDETAGGTAQRFLWLSNADAGAIDPRSAALPEFPGALDWTPPAWDGPRAVMASYKGERRAEMVVAPEVQDEIQWHRYVALANPADVDPLETHGDLSRLKVAALFAVLDGRLDVSAEDWRLAGIVQETSRSVRRRTGAVIHKAERDKAKAFDQRAVERALRVEQATTDNADAVNRVARKLWRHVNRHAEGTECNGRCLHHAASSNDRLFVPAAVARAEALGWLEQTDEGVWRIGVSKPT